MKHEELKELFYSAVEKMIDDGEFDKIVKSFPDHAERVSDFAAAIGEMNGPRNVPIVALLGTVSDDEPVLADVLAYMLYKSEFE